MNWEICWRFYFFSTFLSHYSFIYLLSFHKKTSTFFWCYRQEWQVRQLRIPFFQKLLFVIGLWRVYDPTPRILQWKKVFFSVVVGGCCCCCWLLKKRYDKTDCGSQRHTRVCHTSSLWLDGTPRPSRSRQWFFLSGKHRTCSGERKWRHIKHTIAAIESHHRKRLWRGSRRWSIYMWMRENISNDKLT